MHKHAWQLFLLQVVAHAGLLSMLFWATSLHWLATLLAYFLMGCVGTSIGYHRLFGHKSFVPPRWLWWMCLCFGNLAGAGSSISWVAVHRAHHHHSNKNSADPHSPWHHKWYHVLWFNMFEKVNMRYVKDIAREPAHVWWHRLYFVVHFMLLVILLLISWKLAICAYLAPMALVWSMGSALNFVNHKWGYRNHNTADHSTNNWFYAIFYWGEGWHNNHHANPKKSSFGEHWWEIDVSGVLIAHLRKDIDKTGVANH